MTENEIEQLSIDLLKQQGFTYLNGTDIAPDSSTSERQTFEEVILKQRLENAVRRINPTIPPDAQQDAVKQILRIASPDVLSNNETFHRLLTEGIPVTKRVSGQERGDRVFLIDFENPLHNEFLAVNQFTIVENGVNKRPDLIVFVNGLPLVVIELKNATDDKTTIQSAFRQIETYKAMIPSLFTFNAFSVISDGLEAKAGTISAGLSRFMAWKTTDGISEASKQISQLETLIKGMLQPTVLLDLVRHFVVFEKFKKEDADGIVTVQTVKKLAAYHQYYAVNRAVESTMRAAGYSKKFPSLGGVAESRGGQFPSGGGVPAEGGRGGRNSSNYFSLPYNPALKERAKELRQAGNLSEVLFWNQVKNKQFKGLDFDRQKIIGNYIVDFYCSNCQVVIEIDGATHDDKVEYDANRDAFLERLGLTVIHIPVNDIMFKLGEVMEMLEQHPAFEPPRPLGTPPEEGNRPPHPP
ncbi:type I restriction endonuclease, partial [Weeksella sp. HMSC059D05]|uniref:type I restriction endonuclease n=1 Tax=Weeksella sp. HMSC059D05 TaxID=1715139 RepID=UPI001C87D5F4